MGDISSVFPAAHPGRPPGDYWASYRVDRGGDVDHHELHQDRVVGAAAGVGAHLGVVGFGVGAGCHELVGVCDCREFESCGGCRPGLLH